MLQPHLSDANELNSHTVPHLSRICEGKGRVFLILKKHAL